MAIKPALAIVLYAACVCCVRLWESLCEHQLYICETVRLRAPGCRACPGRLVCCLSVRRRLKCKREICVYMYAHIHHTPRRQTDRHVGGICVCITDNAPSRHGCLGLRFEIVRLCLPETCVCIYESAPWGACHVYLCVCVRAQNSLWHRLVCCVSVRVRACVHKTAFAIAACDVQWMYVYVHICMCIKILYINFV